VTTAEIKQEKPSLLRGWWQALLIYRNPRVLAMLLLGFSAGLPFMLVFSTLSAWLRQSGIDRATIGMLAWVGLVYSIKFLWAPIVDRMPLPILTRLLGRRRSWMLLAQVGVGFGLLHVAHLDPAASISAVAFGTLFVAFCAATQDIVIDAWRIEAAPLELQGGMAAAYQMGYRVAIMVASAGALWIAADFSWQASYTTMALMMGVGVVTTLFVSEPQPRAEEQSIQSEARVIDWVKRNGHLPSALQSAGSWFLGAVVCPIIDFFTRFGLMLGVLVFGFISTYRLTDYAMGVMANPFYLDQGFTLKQIAAVVKGFGVISALVGVLIGGTVIAKLGLRRALITGSIAVMCSNCAFAILAASGSSNIVGLAIVNSMDNLALGIHGTSLIAFMSSLTSARYTATQYAVLSSLYALPGKLLMGASGFVVDALGYSRFFIYTALLSVPGLVLLYWLGKKAPERFTSKPVS
jgi:MFS transporter, PAT family, beta-lactamase induction signal transducer AmpG